MIRGGGGGGGAGTVLMKHMPKSTQRAAVSYIKSFCEDERLVSSLFNHCLILIDLKKVAEAKAS